MLRTKAIPIIDVTNINKYYLNKLTSFKIISPYFALSERWLVENLRPETAECHFNGSFLNSLRDCVAIDFHENILALISKAYYMQIWYVELNFFIFLCILRETFMWAVGTWHIILYVHDKAMKIHIRGKKVLWNIREW